MTDVDPMEGLKRRFLDRCAYDAARLRDADNQQSDEIIEIVHRLSGTAGTLGFAALSECAAQLEDAIRDGEPGATKMEALLKELAKVQAF